MMATKTDTMAEIKALMGDLPQGDDRVHTQARLKNILKMINDGWPGPVLSRSGTAHLIGGIGDSVPTWGWVAGLAGVAYLLLRKK